MQSAHQVYSLQDEADEFLMLFEVFELSHCEDQSFVSKVSDLQLQVVSPGILKIEASFVIVPLTSKIIILTYLKI